MAKVMLKDVIPAVINKVLSEHDIYIEPLSTSSIPGATYTITPVDEGVVNHSQVEIKVIHPDFDKGSEISNEITNLINVKEQDKSIRVNGVELRPKLSGGGWIFSDGPQAYEISSIFIITWRCL